MDLSTIDTLAVAEKGWEYTWVHPKTGIASDMTFSLYGAGSSAFKKGQAKIDQYHKNHERSGKKEDDDELQNLHAGLLALCTRGWKGVTKNGKEVEFSFDNAVDIYTNYPLVANQVLGEIYNVIEQLEKN